MQLSRREFLKYCGMAFADTLMNTNYALIHPVSYSIMMSNEKIFHYLAKFVYHPQETLALSDEIVLDDGRVVTVDYDKTPLSELRIPISDFPDYEFIRKLTDNKTLRERLNISFEGYNIVFMDEGYRSLTKIIVINPNGSQTEIRDINSDGFVLRSLSEGLKELVKVIARYPDFKNNWHIDTLVEDTLVEHSNGGKVSIKTFADLKPEEILMVNIDYLILLEKVFSTFLKKYELSYPPLRIAKSR